MSFTHDFKDSNATWRQFKDQLLTHMKGENLVDIESQDSGLSDMFDQYSGVDAIHLVKRNDVNMMRGVAIRVQWGKVWNTFTIRFQRATGTKTEYEKRCEAIFGEGGFWFPYLTIQLYAEKRSEETKILSCGIVKTRALYEFMRDHPEKVHKQTTREDGNVFLFVFFSDLTHYTDDILIFHDDRLQGERQEKPTTWEEWNARIHHPDPVQLGLL